MKEKHGENVEKKGRFSKPLELFQLLHETFIGSHAPAALSDRLGAGNLVSAYITPCYASNLFALGGNGPIFASLQKMGRTA